MPRSLQRDQIDKSWNGNKFSVFKDIKKASTSEGEWVTKRVIGDEERGINTDQSMWGLADYGEHV